MYTRGRTLRYTAVLTLVVLTLTGFSDGRGHGGGKSRSGKSRSGTSGRHSGGGGCSSSEQDHDASRSSGTHRTHRRSTPTASSTGGSGGTALDEATVVLVHCATTTKPYSTVEVTNPNSRKGTFHVQVVFVDDAGDWLASSGQQVTVSAKATKTVRVRPADTTVVDRALTCRAEPFADVTG